MMTINECLMESAPVALLMCAGYFLLQYCTTPAGVPMRSVSSAKRNESDQSGANSFRVDSPRSVEACRRCGVEEDDPAAQPQLCFHRPPPGKRSDKAAAVIRAERHEVNRHRLLREVRNERAKIVQEQGTSQHAATASDTSTAARPISSGRAVGTSDNARGLLLASREEDESQACQPPAGGWDPVLESESQRLRHMKKRQAMELKQMLSYELRQLAREELDRRRAEKASEKAAAAEARRNDLLRAADCARGQREREYKAKEKEIRRAASLARAKQEEAARRLEEQEELRKRQLSLAARKRAGETAVKAAILDSRIARGARVRRAKQLRNERAAAKRADEREAAAAAAKRARNAENEARKAAAAERAAIIRAAAEETRRQRLQEAESARSATEGKVADLEARAEAFRRRQKENADRERALREEEAADATRQRREAAQQKLASKAKRRLDELEAKGLREKQIALALEVRRKQDAERRQHTRREKNEQMKIVQQRRTLAEERRREATRRKLAEDTVKVELLRYEKERLHATRSALSFETAKQREALREHFDALKDQSKRRLTFDAIAAAVCAAADTERAGDGQSLAGSRPIRGGIDNHGLRNLARRRARHDADDVATDVHTAIPAEGARPEPPCENLRCETGNDRGLQDAWDIERTSQIADGMNERGQGPASVSPANSPPVQFSQLYFSCTTPGKVGGPGRGELGASCRMVYKPKSARKGSTVDELRHRYNSTKPSSFIRRTHSRTGGKRTHAGKSVEKCEANASTGSVDMVAPDTYPLDSHDHSPRPASEQAWEDASSSINAVLDRPAKGQNRARRGRLHRRMGNFSGDSTNGSCSR